MDKKLIEDLVAEVRDDYERRQAERRQFEAQWQLNANFVAGNQYCRVGVKGEVEDCEKDYYWQEREVYNHIATIYGVQRRRRRQDGKGFGQDSVGGLRKP